MTKFTVWYKKEIQAKNVREAVNKEKRVKPTFHSIVEEEPKEIEQRTSAIGFEI